MFWKLLEREADWLPPWRDLLMCLRRLDARGEIRGGRFVSGFLGEQFALPHAVDSLRLIRKEEETEETITISSADPLNLTGIILPGDKITSNTKKIITLKNGIPLDGETVKPHLIE